MISRDNLSALLTFNPSPYLTTSLYLQTDGSIQQNYAIHLKDLIKQAKQSLESKDLSNDILKSVESDFRKMTDFINLEFSRDGARTVAIFTCSGKKNFQVFKLNLPFRSELTINSRFNVRQLLLLLNEHRRFLVIVIERSRARLFEVFAGEILEHPNILDEVPSKVKVGGFGGYEERKIERHIEDHVRRHFKRVEDAAQELNHKHSNDYIVLWGSEQNTSDFARFLPRPFHERVFTAIHDDHNASANAILERIMRLELDVQRKEERRLLETLFNEVNSGGIGVVGLDSTIRALQQGQVQSLVVHEGFVRDGFQCKGCLSLLITNGACDYCGGETHKVADIVEEAVHTALTQGCPVRFISGLDSRLSAAGNIGAMLRFKT